ncbi:MAG TPA: FliH/SctL family protein [Phycisphaerales bacterium]|nr:FliH/SctL family protein [Phycisphaerales bacterium]
MPLIKCPNPSGLPRDAVVLDLGDLLRQGEEIVDHARTRAETIVSEALAQRARLVSGAESEGRARGFAKGLEEGRVEGARAARIEAMAERQAELKAIASGWSEGLAQFRRRRDDLVRAAEVDVLRLALAIAEKVTRRVIEVDPGVVRAQLDAVLALVLRPTRLAIHVHPEDHVLVEEILPDVLRVHAAGEHVTLVEDATLARGSCLARSLEPGGGTIDASIGTQLSRLAEALLPSAPAANPPETTP